MQTITIDIDGICFDPTARLERCKDEKGKIDWEKAFSDKEIIKDLPFRGAAKATHTIWKRFRFCYLTGRSQSCHEATLIALRRCGFRLAPIEMRKRDDFRSDHEIKTERIKSFQENGFDFAAAIDDDYNGKLKPMYESLGIPCFTSFEEFFESEVWRGNGKN